MRYAHDCTRCRCLGQYEQYDLYFCLDIDGDSGSVLARYGNEDHEYASTMLGYTRKIYQDYNANTGTDHATALRIAELIVHDMGLCTKFKEPHVIGYRVIDLTLDKDASVVRELIPNEREALKEACNQDELHEYKHEIEVVRVMYQLEE